MHSTVAMRQKTNTKQDTCSTEETDSFRDKRRLLSYWKSLDSLTCPVNNESGSFDVKNELVLELKKCISELDDLDSPSSTAREEATFLQNEQLSLLKQLGQYSVYLTDENSDLNDFKNTKKDSEVLEASQPERDLLLRENENFVKQMEEQKNKFQSLSEEQQRDIEKLTREVQNFNISRRKLERELQQLTKHKNESEATINSLRQEMKSMRDSFEEETQKLSNMNDQVSRENSELVEKGKEATESLKIALHQLTEEKKAIQMQRKSSSGKDIRELQTSLERAKKEREAFRQRCEKSEMLQRNLQEEISSLANDLAKEKELSSRSSYHKEIVDSGDRSVGREKFTSDDGGDSSQYQGLQQAHARITQLKKYVHVLEGRIKEKDETVLSLRKENAKVNDVAMEKSLELSRSRRILERKIEKLTNENSELKIKFLMPSSYNRNRGNEGSESKQQQDNPLKQRERSRREVLEGRHRRRSNPERSAIETTLKRLNNEKSLSNSKNESFIAPVSNSSGNQLDKLEDQDFGKSTLSVPLDLTPRRRIGGKFIRASSNRHSADLGRLMSRPEPAITKKSDSEMLHEDEPATIFINKYRKKSEEEEHWV